jgi:hypothetical protein
LVLGAAPVEEPTPIASVIRYVDFRHAALDPDLVEGREGVRTSPAALGLGMAVGTDEGPGPLYAARAAVLALADRRRGHPDPHAPKIPFVDLSEGVRGRFLGLVPARAVGMIPWSERHFAHARRMAARRGIADDAWVPQVLPVQIARIGPVAVVALPFEPTTVVGRRLRAVLAPTMRDAGVTHVVVNGYANAYAGYVCTPEEYTRQHYEAAFTLFGPHTLGACATVARRLARRLGAEADPLDTGPQPVHHAIDDLDPGVASGRRGGRRSYNGRAA